VAVNDHVNALASPAMGHWGTCPLRLPTVFIFLVTSHCSESHKL